MSAYSTSEIFFIDMSKLTPYVTMHKGDHNLKTVSVISKYLKEVSFFVSLYFLL